MVNLFCASEIIEMGIEANKKEKEFYERISKKTKSRDVKETFKYLASQEEKHISELNKILTTIEKCVPFEQYPEEYSLYIQSLLSRHTFSDKKTKDLLKGIKTNADAIDTAVEL